jgi:hypothetical protein
MNRAAELAARTTQFNTAAPQPQEQARALLDQLLATGGEVRACVLPGLLGVLDGMTKIHNFFKQLLTCKMR